MFGKRKRPWAKYAIIERQELNSGEFKFWTTIKERDGPIVKRTNTGPFESLTDAEAHLNSWWTDWWPKQVKRTRRA